MYCGKCGNELKEGELFCGKCGYSEKEENADKKISEKKYKRIKIDVMEVINSKDVLNTKNKVAYIAKGWALQVKNRGQNFAIIAFIIYFIIGIAIQSNAGSIDDTQYWLMYSAYGLLVAIIIIAIFNTTAFIIRMGAEVIELLNDIKNK